MCPFEAVYELELMWQYKTTDAVIWRAIDHIATLKIEQ